MGKVIYTDYGVYRIPGKSISSATLIEIDKILDNPDEAINSIVELANEADRLNSKIDLEVTRATDAEKKAKTEVESSSEHINITKTTGSDGLDVYTITESDIASKDLLDELQETINGLIGQQVESLSERIDDIYKNEPANAEVGDVIYKNGDKFFACKPDDYDPSLGQAVGVCAIPSSHDVYGTGECGIIALRNSSTGVEWGAYGTDVPTLDNLKTVPKLGGNTMNYGYLPSETGSYSNTPNLVSPYASDGSRNPLANVGAMNDFDGVGNTAKLIAFQGLDANYAAQSAKGYADGGIDWYLGASGEMSYLYPRLTTIDSTLTTLQSFDNTVSPVLSAWFWSSSEYNNYSSWNMDLGNGYFYYYDKNDLNYVRPWGRVLVSPSTSGLLSELSDKVDNAVNEVKAYTDEVVTSLIDSAPETFDTLKEIADWISNDEIHTANIILSIQDNIEAIAQELSRAELAEATINMSITTNTNAINGEILRATSIELDLQNQIDDANLNVETIANLVQSSLATIVGGEESEKDFTSLTGILKVIEEDEEVIAAALNDLNSRLLNDLATFLEMEETILSYKNSVDLILESITNSISGEYNPLTGELSLQWSDPALVIEDNLINGEIKFSY